MAKDACPGTEGEVMRIAILGWGSLIWDPRDPCVQGDWQPDGPRLPIKVARTSEGLYVEES